MVTSELTEVELLDELSADSRLTRADAEEVAAKIDEDALDRANEELD